MVSNTWGTITLFVIKKLLIPYLSCFSLLITNTTVKPTKLTTSKAEPNVFNTKLLLNPVLGKDLSIFFL